MRMKIYDFGCGAHKFPGAVGVDIDPSSGADIVANIECASSALGENVADMVVMRHVIEHVNALDCLREAWKVLKPRGAIYIETPNPYSAPIIIRLFFHNKYVVSDEHIQTFGPEELKNILRKAGFTVTKFGYKYELEERFKDPSVPISKTRKLGQLIWKLRPQFSEVLWMEGLKP